MKKDEKENKNESDNEKMKEKVNGKDNKKGKVSEKENNNQKKKKNGHMDEKKNMDEKEGNGKKPDGAGEVNEPVSVYQSGEPLNFEKVWQMFQETDKKFQETSRQFKETDKKFQETSRQFKETDKKFQESRMNTKETERIMKEQSRETEKRLQETDRILKEQFRETARLISELREEYKNRWGELIESLVSGNLLRVLKARGIPVSKTRKHVMQYKGEPNYEFDIVASNGDEVVVVEVKSTLNPEAVKHFIHQIKLARKSSRRFRTRRIIGAVAYLKDHCDASAMAMKRGLLVIRATGDSAEIINEEGFVPVRF